MAKKWFQNQQSAFPQTNFYVFIRVDKENHFQSLFNNLNSDFIPHNITRNDAKPWKHLLEVTNKMTEFGVNYFQTMQIVTTFLAWKISLKHDSEVCNSKIYRWECQ